ncbi:UNVERIFIED_CONTAM: hypothetical protein Slati_2775000 [Sesamum latifolium]|uniref:Retrotransposon gag domain-containing protein n=1 Tax=Sesamum latifolium TaxID=2727402 RepID=A0AAW2VYD1_9LAMI
MAALLFTVRQKEKEPLRDYMERFVEAVHEVPHVNHELLTSIIQQNLSHGRFKKSIAGKPPSTMEDLLMRSQKYIRIKESNASTGPDGRRLSQREKSASSNSQEKPLASSYSRIDNAQLRKVNTPLTGFSGEMIEQLEEVILSLSFCSLSKRSTKMIKFLVVKAPSAYNIILERPSLNLFRAIASTLHMKLKFPTSVGVGEAVGDELMARECYANTLKRPREKLDGKASDVKGKRMMIDMEHKVRDTP